MMWKFPFHKQYILFGNKCSDMSIEVYEIMADRSTNWRTDRKGHSQCYTSTTPTAAKTIKQWNTNINLNNIKQQQQHKNNPNNT